MSSDDDIQSSLDDPCRLAALFREKSHSVVSDDVFALVTRHFLSQPVSIDRLGALRNLYGRPRSSSLESCELDLLIFNIKTCLTSDSHHLTLAFLQYMHNINRLLPVDYRDMAYLCALVLLPLNTKNVGACILSAYLETKPSTSPRFDLIINGIYENENENEDEYWMEQLAKILIDHDREWLRKFYLEKRYNQQLLQAIDAYNKEQIVTLIQTEFDSEEMAMFDEVNKLPFYSNLTQVSSLDDLHSTLTSFVATGLSHRRITASALIHLFGSSKNYPHDVHALFACSLASVLHSNNCSRVTINLFRRLILLMNNYYIHQQDLLDDNRLRLTVVSLVSSLLVELHRRRSNTEHEWYRLHVDVPNEHPLPTFDLFADLLCLLATLCYQQIDCQNEVRQVSGTIEAILSMTRIDLNQPKAPACVMWLMRCLTEFNELNREYIKQIK